MAQQQAQLNLAAARLAAISVSQSLVLQTYYISTELYKYFFRILPLYRPKSTAFFQAARKPAPRGNPDHFLHTSTHTLLQTPILLPIWRHASSILGCLLLLHPPTLLLFGTVPVPLNIHPSPRDSESEAYASKLVTPFRTKMMLSLFQSQTWNNMQLSEQHRAVVNQEPRPPNPMGLFLAVPVWLLDTKLPLIARTIIAIYFVINHSYGKALFTPMVVVTWMAIAQFTT